MEVDQTPQRLNGPDAGTDLAVMGVMALPGALSFVMAAAGMGRVSLETAMQLGVVTPRFFTDHFIQIGINQLVAWMQR